MRDDEYFAIKTRAAAVLRKIPHVTAIGMGGRERDGRPTGEIVIKVFVNRKKPPHEVPPGEMIPSQFEDVPTDVVAMTPPVPHLDPVPGSVAPGGDLDMDKTEPLEGGIILGVEPNGNGTLGCFLRDKNDGTVYGLTNAHVLDDATRKISQSRRILRAAGGGGFDLPPVGYATAFTDKDPFDCAVVRLQAGLNWLPSIKEIGSVAGAYEVTLADSVTQLYNVRKRGARTKLTGGILIAIGVELVDFPQAKKLDIVIRPNPQKPPHENGRSCFSDRGDSGSVLVNDDNEVIALLWGSQDTQQVSTVQRLVAVATTIGPVLEHFKKAHHLDLEVVPSSGPSPPPALPPPGAPLRPVADVLKNRDGGHHRPLAGGSQVLGAPFGSANSGTLGCVVTKTGEPGTAYILTSYDRLSAGGQVPPSVGTSVGQPDNTGSCSACCRNTVAGFTKGGPDLATPTVAALAKLEKDQTWLAEVMEIGFLEGTAEVTADEINSGKCQVRKRGMGSRLTGGFVTAVGGVAGELPDDVKQRDPNAMLVRPNPNPLKDDAELCFSTSFDRGAVLVNEKNKVVGLLYDEKEIVLNGVKIVHGVARPIALVLNALNSLPDVTFQVATASAPDQKHTTTARTITEHDVALPPLVEDLPPLQNDPGAALDWLRAELSHSIAGRLAIDLWSNHRGEIGELINHHRKVATVWHRSGGPALLQAFTRAVHAPTLKIPASVNGLPTSACLDRLAAAFRRYGSPTLCADVSRLRSALPSIGGFSLAEILAALDTTRATALGH
jgi:hypothetical protein